MYKLVEQALGEVIWSGRTITISKLELQSLIQTKYVPRKVTKSILSNSWRFAPVPETVDSLLVSGWRAPLTWPQGSVNNMDGH